MNPNDESWKKNVQSRGRELQQMLDDVLSHLHLASDPNQKQTFANKLSALISKANATHEMFAKEYVPQHLHLLSSTLTHWKTRLNDHNDIKTITRLTDQIARLGDEETESGFSEILNRHKEDGQLQDCLQELIEALEKLLEEGDDTLSRQAATDLERILKEIKKRKNQSIFDLNPWLEYALVALATLHDVHYETPIGKLIAGALIAAKKSGIRILELKDSAIVEYFKNLALKGQEKWNFTRKEQLLNASIEEIEAALKEEDGLNKLPALNPPAKLTLEG